jgi:hypothetical protein
MQQQEFLRSSMQTLSLTRQGLADRLRVSKRTLDKWLLPSESNDFRPLNEPVWALLREILEHEELKKRHQKLMNKISE